MNANLIFCEIDAFKKNCVCVLINKNEFNNSIDFIDSI